MVTTFTDVVFSYLDGEIPIRMFAEKGQSSDQQPRTIWISNDDTAADQLAHHAAEAARVRMAFYVVPGVVAQQGQGRAADVRQMQSVVVDLDSGDVPLKLDHLRRHLGEPTLLVASGGRTDEGADKLHVWWKLSEPAEGEDITRLCRLRAEIAAKVGGDSHFGSAHQPIRVAGSIHNKNDVSRLVRVVDHSPQVELNLDDMVSAAATMPSLVAAEPRGAATGPIKPHVDAALTTPVREGGQDEWTRFQGASAAIGYYVRLMHQGRLSRDEGWEAICGYNEAMLRPPWPIERLQVEMKRLWKLHFEKNGPPTPPKARSSASGTLTSYSLRSLLADNSPMPQDLVGPRVLTPGGMLVLGGAPKVGKSDFLISLLLHAAAGVPFLCFTAPRPLRVFFLQAEIQYHYLRERLQQLKLDPAVVAAAADNLVVTPKLKLLLDERGVDLVATAIAAAFPGAPPDIICVDPIRNLFDGGPGGDGENDNSAMLFFLQERVEVLRDKVAPLAGIILAHHTKKLSKTQVRDDPFLALSGASALRGFYTTGMILFRPDEARQERELHFELRNGPALDPIVVDKRRGHWVQIERSSERIVRQEAGAKMDAERDRKRDVIVQLLFDEARAGRLYTGRQFAEKFDNQAGLGGTSTIRERISTLATKGYIKFLRDARPFDLPASTSTRGYLVVEGMVFGPDGESVDPETGEVTLTLRRVLPSHFKAAESGAVLEVENPEVWVYAEGEMDP
jgi:hypothetical protein